MVDAQREKVLTLKGENRLFERECCHSKRETRLSKRGLSRSEREYWLSERDCSRSERERRRFEGHAGRVEQAALTGDGRYLVSCGHEKDPTVRVWDFASGKQLYCSEPCPGGFLSLAVFPDGHRAVTGGRDGVVRLWRWKD